MWSLKQPAECKNPEEMEVRRCPCSTKQKNPSKQKQLQTDRLQSVCLNKFRVTHQPLPSNEAQTYSACLLIICSSLLAVSSFCSLTEHYVLKYSGKKRI